LLSGIVAFAASRASATVILPNTFDFFSCTSGPFQCADSQGRKAGSFSAASVPVGPNGLQGAELFSTSPVESLAFGASGVHILTDIDMVIYGTIDGSGTIPAGVPIPLAYNFELQLDSGSNTAVLDSWSLAYQIDRDSLLFSTPALATNIGGALSGSTAMISGSVNPGNMLTRPLVPSSSLSQCGGQCPIELDVELQVWYSFGFPAGCGAGTCGDFGTLDMQGQFAFNSASITTPEPGSMALCLVPLMLLLCSSGLRIRRRRVPGMSTPRLSKSIQGDAA